MDYSKIYEKYPNIEIEGVLGLTDEEILDVLEFLAEERSIETRIFDIRIIFADDFFETRKKIHFRPEQATDDKNRQPNGETIPVIFQNEEYKASKAQKCLAVINCGKMELNSIDRKRFIRSVVVHEVSHCLDYLTIYPEFSSRYKFSLEEVDDTDVIINHIGGLYEGFSEMQSKYLQEKYFIRSRYGDLAVQNYEAIIYKAPNQNGIRLIGPKRPNIDDHADPYYWTYHMLGKFRAWNEVFAGYESIQRMYRHFMENYLKDSQKSVCIKQMLEVESRDGLIRKCDELYHIPENTVTVIMAGGKGTRISELFPDIPKPLIPIEGVPVLEREIKSLVSQGFKRIILTVSYKAEQIKEYFGDGSRIGAEIEYFEEETPLGNAGALFKLLEGGKLSESFLLLNADSVFDVNFRRFVHRHYEEMDDDGLVTLFTHPNSHPQDSGLIVADDEFCVEKWLTKEDQRPKWYKNRVNAGLHILNTQVLTDAVNSGAVDVQKIGVGDGSIYKVDLDRQILKPLCRKGKVYCYDSPEYVKDMGTPERYESVCEDFRAGIVEAKNLRHKQKAIFLDRDGTIIKYVGFLRSPEELQLIEGTAKAIRHINESGYLAIVVTNQPVIARGEVTEVELNLIHNKLETLLSAEGAYIDELYYCPHHPDKGFPGEVAELKIDCDCRKPKPGMLLEASRAFNIDLSNSWMVGDGKNDVLAGQAAGCRTALIVTSEQEATPEQEKIADTDFGQDIMVSNLLEAVDRILEAR